jgi:hypothetical protein
VGEKRKAHMLSVGKPEEWIPLGRPCRRWVDNIKMDLGETGWGGVDWIGLAQDRNRSCEYGTEPSGSIKCWELSSGYTTGGLSSSAQLYRVNKNIAIF